MQTKRVIGGRNLETFTKVSFHLAKFLAINPVIIEITLEVKKILDKEKGGIRATLTTSM